MDREKRKAIEAAGFRVGDAGDFLELTDEERQLVELRVTVSQEVRRQREEQHLSQKELATRMRSSQSRVAKIERGSRDVSLDLMFRGLFAAGGTLSAPGLRAACRKKNAAPSNKPDKPSKGKPRKSKYRDR